MRNKREVAEFLFLLHIVVFLEEIPERSERELKEISAFVPMIVFGAFQPNRNPVLTTLADS